MTGIERIAQERKKEMKAEFEQFRKDLGEGKHPEFADKLLDIIHGDYDCWGVWDDDGPYHVKADGRTIEEAAKILQSHGYEDWIVYAAESGIKQKQVWDCPFDEEKPCDDPTCRHNHVENVYEFYVAEHLDDFTGCAFVLYPEAAEIDRLQGEGGNRDGF